MYIGVRKHRILALVRKQAPTTKDHYLGCWSRTAVQGGDAGRGGGWCSLGAEHELKV